VTTNKIVTAAALPDGFLQVEFSDGRFEEFDVKPYMTSDFFVALRNQDYFKQLGLFFSGVGWVRLEPRHHCDTLAADGIAFELIFR